MIFIGADVPKKKKKRFSNVHGNSVAFSVLKVVFLKLTSTCTLLLCILCILCSCLYVKSLSGNAEMLRTCEDVNLSSRTHAVGATNAAEHMLVTVLSVNPEIFIY